MPRRQPDTGVFRALADWLGLSGTEAISFVQTDEVLPVMDVQGSIERRVTQVWAFQDVDNIGGSGSHTYDLSPWAGDWELLRKGRQIANSLPDDAEDLDYFILGFGVQAGTAANVTFARVVFANSTISPTFEILAWRGADSTGDNIYDEDRNSFEIPLPWRIRREDGWFPRLQLNTTDATQIRINAIIMTAPPGVIPYRKTW